MPCKNTWKQRGINCFFSGSSCTGLYPVDVHSDLSGCVLSKFNLVNNSDSNGYFRINNPNFETMIKELVISFSSAPAKWLIGLNQFLVWWKCTFVIAKGEPQADQYDQLVDKASMYGHFQSHPGRIECNSISKKFSYSPSVSLLLSFSLLSLTIQQPF